MTGAGWTDWAVFASVLGALLGIDLVSHRKGREQSQKAALFWSLIWISAGLLFAFYVWVRLGRGAGEEYLAAYFIEKSLSLDNLFVFLLIFQSLRIPRENQHTVLLWGIFGALVFRAVAVVVGVAALSRFTWVQYVFASILLLAAVAAFRKNPAHGGPPRLLKVLARRFPVRAKAAGNRFFVRQNGTICATPLLLALVTIELTDIVFAIDSVPAALSVTRQEFLVYSSNAFAILGLRSLYLLLAGTIATMRYLHHGIGFVLAFAATKMLLDGWVEIPPALSAGIVLTAIAAAVGASVIKARITAAQ